jgi:hypothetical protein
VVLVAFAHLLMQSNFSKILFQQCNAGVNGNKHETARIILLHPCDANAECLVRAISVMLDALTKYQSKSLNEVP